MSDYIIEVAENFWNVRGSYRVAGLLDVGTQASLVRLASGRFVMLDSYSFSDDVADELEKITGGDGNIDAVINLHPFHTLHVEYAHQRYPGATHYGTARHLARFPGLPWAQLKSEDPELHTRFGDDLEFTIPRGVDFISADENIHFSSVMAYHPASRTIHSDDTLGYIKGPGLLKLTGLGDSVSFHPTLSKALERRKGAAADFRNWAKGMIKQWRKVENLCAAHTTALVEWENKGDSIHARMLKALEKTRSVLEAHEGKYG
jgi:hypothetical protein